MTTLALLGGTPEVQGPLAPFNTIGQKERSYVMNALKKPLSGFLGGQERGGWWVRHLEDEWCETFGVKHAVACNSATSGLLAACAAINVNPGDQVICSPFTMSASSAAPTFFGAEIAFNDIEDRTFCLDPDADSTWTHSAHAAVVTNLFGHPAQLARLASECRKAGVFLIEDNAQSPFASEGGKLAGTFGDVGIFSYNVHKPLQAGEGGMCLTNDEALALEMRHFINHGEMAGRRPGLNLRLTEFNAAIMLAQLERAESIIDSRIRISEHLTQATRDLPVITPPFVRESCRSVFYCWAAKVSGDRDFFVRALQAEGVPIRKGYTEPTYRLPAFAKFARPCPVAERMQDKEIILVEICAIDPTIAQLHQIGNSFTKVCEYVSEHQRVA